MLRPHRPPNRCRVAGSQPNREWKPGFSLLEMMIVLAIMAGMVAMAWPNLQRSLQKASLEEAAASVRSVLDDARYQAMLRGQCWLVRVEKNSGVIHSGALEQFALQAPVSVHRLPESMQVVEVRWSSTIPAKAEDETQPSDQPDSLEQPVWWIPILANGTGKDLSIRLQDPVTGRSSWVVFLGSTGSVEVYP